MRRCQGPHEATGGRTTLPGASRGAAKGHSTLQEEARGSDSPHEGTRGRRGAKRAVRSRRRLGGAARGWRGPRELTQCDESAREATGAHAGRRERKRGREGPCETTKGRERAREAGRSSREPARALRGYAKGYARQWWAVKCCEGPLGASRAARRAVQSREVLLGVLKARSGWRGAVRGWEGPREPE